MGVVQTGSTEALYDWVVGHRNSGEREGGRRMSLVLLLNGKVSLNVSTL